jgi:hypothetical protein
MSCNAIDSDAVMKELLRFPLNEEDVIAVRICPAVLGPSVVSLVEVFLRLDKAAN